MSNFTTREESIDRIWHDGVAFPAQHASYDHAYYQIWIGGDDPVKFYRWDGGKHLVAITRDDIPQF